MARPRGWWPAVESGWLTRGKAQSGRGSVDWRLRTSGLVVVEVLVEAFVEAFVEASVEAFMEAFVVVPSEEGSW